MTVTDQINILNRKVLKNEAQYDLDRKAAKMSALSSNNLDKYEYLTGEDLGLRPSTVEQVEFEYSPLSKIFNKGLSENDKKEGLFKRLKNIKSKIKSEDKKELKLIKNKKQPYIAKDKWTVVDKRPKKVVLLKDTLDFIFKTFGSNFDSTGKNFLAKLGEDK